MTLAINILLWLVVGVPWRSCAAMRGRVLLNDGARDGVIEFIKLLPRIGIGVVGSGFIAEVLPERLIAPWLGPELDCSASPLRRSAARSRRAGRWSDFPSAPPRSRAAPARRK